MLILFFILILLKIVEGSKKESNALAKYAVALFPEKSNVTLCTGILISRYEFLCWRKISFHFPDGEKNVVVAGKTNFNYEDEQHASKKHFAKEIDTSNEQIATFSIEPPLVESETIKSVKSYGEVQTKKNQQCDVFRWEKPEKKKDFELQFGKVEITQIMNGCQKEPPPKDDDNDDDEKEPPKKEWNTHRRSSARLFCARSLGGPCLFNMGTPVICDGDLAGFYYQDEGDSGECVAEFVDVKSYKDRDLFHRKRSGVPSLLTSTNFSAQIFLNLFLYFYKNTMF